ncbi:hypothetical protein ACP4OV_005667 [Aristida adscensionis]
MAAQSEHVGGPCRGHLLPSHLCAAGSDGGSNGKHTIILGQDFMAFCSELEDIHDIGRHWIQAINRFVPNSRRKIQFSGADYCVFHSPYNKLVQKSFAQLYFNDFMRNCSLSLLANESHAL